MSERYTAEVLVAPTFTGLAEAEAALVREVTERGGAVEYLWRGTSVNDEQVGIYRVTEKAPESHRNGPQSAEQRPGGRGDGGGA